MAAGRVVAMTPEQHVWACAAAVERQHGERAPLFIAERIGALALAGDEASVAMWKSIAARLQELRSGSGTDCAENCSQKPVQ